MVRTYTYKTFGTISEETGTLENPYTYTGREYDSETGLFYYRARHYDAALGRFIQKDPIGLAGGMNVYAYVGNNPVNYVDPWGKIPGEILASHELVAIDAFRYFISNFLSGDFDPNVEHGGWIIKLSETEYTYYDIFHGFSGEVNLGTAPANAVADFHYHNNTGTNPEIFSDSGDQTKNYDDRVIGYLLTPTYRVLRNTPIEYGTWESGASLGTVECIGIFQYPDFIRY